MRRTATVLIAVVVVVGTVAAVPMTGLAQQTTETSTPTDGDSAESSADGNATAENATAGNATPPGDLLEGVIGVQEAEIDGEIENRTFGIRVAQAATTDAKADVVSEQLKEIRTRLQKLEERKQELKEARANGSISQGEYRSEIAKLAVKTQNTKQLTNHTANVSEDLPEDVLREKGINVSAIRTLSEQADELTGPEVSKIARSIAGPSVADDASDGASERRDGRGAGTGSAADGADSGNRTASGSQGTETTDRPDGSRTDDGTDSDTTDTDAGSGSGAASRP